MRCFLQLLREQHAQRAQLLQRGLCQVLRLPFSASMPCCRYCPFAGLHMHTSVSFPYCALQSNASGTQVRQFSGHAAAGPVQPFAHADIGCTCLSCTSLVSLLIVDINLIHQPGATCTHTFHQKTQPDAPTHHEDSHHTQHAHAPTVHQCHAISHTCHARCFYGLGEDIMYSCNRFLSASSPIHTNCIYKYSQNRI